VRRLYSINSPVDRGLDRAVNGSSVVGPQRVAVRVHRFGWRGR